MKKTFLYAALSFLMFAVVSCKTGEKDYESVAGDPINARIYTLDNGLKVYMAVNKEVPRIQTYIAVRAGSKNDPAETTGLAHYFEHLMFKGTPNFGTSDYQVEKPLLDQIEQLFEVYRQTTDPEQRIAIYHQIDSISQEASKYAIPNEYDKLMSTIGADGTNAYTSSDVTCYVEDIPSNQVENWARIQADRFANPVIRGFHTELETIYEEYNMGLTQDSRQVWEATLSGLFPHHPYGQQTTIGRPEHLKNPSITNVKNFHKQWYVPNNMAVCLSGDFDPEETLEIIKKYFGGMQPNENLTKLEFPAEEPITEPVVKEVLGLEAENVTLAWRTFAAADSKSDVAQIAASILSNGQAGLIDLDLQQKQKVLGAYAYNNAMSDYGCFEIYGRPKDGQTLEEVRDLLLEELAKLRNGDFDESLLKAGVDNYKLSMQRYLDSNSGRADAFVDAFINGISWEDKVNLLSRMEKITKEDVVKFANEMLNENNYVIVYKREGKRDIKKLDKLVITPISANRDAVSEFVKVVQNTVVKDIEPAFVDFEKDMTKTKAKSDIEVLYKKNETTDLFELMYVFNIGSNNDATLSTAFSYLDYLGTSTKSAEEIKKEFYNIACSFGASVQKDRCYLSVEGLSENMPQAMALMEEIIADAQPDESVLDNMKMDIMMSRANAKKNQSRCFNALRQYSMFGGEYIKSVTLNNDALAQLTSDELLGKVKDLMKKQHYVMYYGPNDVETVVAEINKSHNVPETLEPIEKVETKYLETSENQVLIAEYDAKQLYYTQYSNRGDKFDVANDAVMNLYNEYFGGGMNSIVFQEMREARGLAYSASAWLTEHQYATQPYTYTAFIATQNEKLQQAMEAFADIINNMPESEAAFNIAKEALIARIRTDRTIKSSVLWAYLDAQDLGVMQDRNKAVFEQVQNMTLADVKAFQEQWIKNRTYTYCILGDSKDIDLNYLRTIGPIKFLSQEEIFGY